MSRRESLVLAVVCGLVAIPGVAFADGALPTVVVAFPGMAVMFIPIVVIEAVVLARMLELGTWHALRVSAASNAVTTVLGVPMAGMLIAVLTTVGVTSVDPSTTSSWAASAVRVLTSAGWLTNPAHGTMQAEVATALMVLIVPFFLMSWWIEYLVSARMLRAMEGRRVNRAVLVGNVLSYLLIAVVLVVLRVWFRV